MQISAFAMEEGVWLDAEENVEIAGRPPAHTGFAFAGEADARAVLDAGGNVDLERPLAPHTALPGAGPARFLDHLALSAARRASPLDGEKSLRRAHLAVAAARRTRDRLRAGLGAAAIARFARRRARHPDVRRLAEKRVLEADVEVVAQVGAVARAGLPAAPADEFAEHLVEDVGETAHVESEIAAALSAAAAKTIGPGFERGMTEAIVSGALLLVLEDVVSLADILEFLLGLLVPRIAVGVELHGELPVGLLEVLRAGATVDAQGRVVVLLGHGRMSGNRDQMSDVR